MIRRARNPFRTIVAVAHDLASLMSLAMRSHAQLAAENLFLRRQLALYMERRVRGVNYFCRGVLPQLGMLPVCDLVVRGVPKRQRRSAVGAEAPAEIAAR